ncbi:hypothetical protein VPH35_033289 [Triticum aestivum]
MSTTGKEIVTAAAGAPMPMVGVSQFPRLDREDYALWAMNMEVAMEGAEFWEAVDPGGAEYAKGTAKYRIDRQALTAIYSAMPKDVLQHLVGKKTAKEAWETIKILHQGHDRVKEAHLQSLMRSYECLKMDESETVDQFAARLKTLVNGIRSYGSTLEEVAIVRRFLRAAPARYIQIVTSIEQCLDLKTLTVEDLVGRFKAHDERIRLSFGDAEASEHLMLTKAQWIALSKEKQGGSTSGGKKKGKGKQRSARKNFADSDDEAVPAPPRRKFDIRKVRCHKCGLLGHFKANCEEAPKQQALMAEEGDDGDMMLMCELVDEEYPDDLGQLDTCPVSPSAPVNPGDVVAPEDHDTRRDGVVMPVKPGEFVAPEDHNARRDGVVMLAAGEEVAPEVHGTMRDGVIALEAGEEVAPEDHNARRDDVVTQENNEDVSPEQLESSATQSDAPDDGARRDASGTSNGSAGVPGTRVVASPRSTRSTAWSAGATSDRHGVRGVHDVPCSSASCTGGSDPADGPKAGRGPAPSSQPGSPAGRPATGRPELPEGPALAQPSVDHVAGGAEGHAREASPAFLAGSTCERAANLEGTKLPENGTLASTEASVSSPTARERRLLDLSPTEAFQINSVKMKSKGQRHLHIEEPESFEDAKTEECWRRAMDEELGSIRDNYTWELADLPNGHNAIELKWVYKVKKDAKGNLVKHKAKLVAKSNMQDQGVDFEEVFAPLARMDTVRLLIALAAQESWRIHHMDVNSALLTGELEEELYVKQPPGYIQQGEEHKVLKLHKALYGLRQAPWAWSMKLDSTLISLGFEKAPLEHTMYKRGKGKDRLLVGIYVDDLLITGADEEVIANFKLQMEELFKMTDLGLLSYYLGIEVQQKPEAITICQEAYAKKVLESCGMKDCNPSHVPMKPCVVLSKKSEAPAVDATEYRSVVRKLRYLTNTRPDLAYSVGIVSRFMEAPTTEHWAAVEHILRYIKGTTNFGCVYLREKKKEMVELLGYSDSDLAGDVDDRKSTSGVAYFLGGSIVSWLSQKQKVVALSSREAEYIAAATAVCQGVCLGRLLGDLTGKERVVLKVDDKSTVSLWKNPVCHYGNWKHIDTRYRYLRECVEESKIDINYVCTNDQLADILTRSLGRQKFVKMRRRIGVQAVT